MAEITQKSSINYYQMARWKGIFVDSLYKACQEVHPGTGIDKAALDHIEELIIRLLCDMIDMRPMTIQDVEKKVQLSYPSPMNCWPLTDAHDAVKVHTKKSKTLNDKLLPPLLHKIHPLLKDCLGYKIEERVTLFIAAVLLYIASDILKLTGNYVKNIRSNQITLQDLKIALRADRVLMEMFYHGVDEEATGLSFIAEEFVNLKTQETTYEKTARDLIHFELQYLRELNLLVQVFRRAFEYALPPKSKDLDVVFSNIMEIHELTVKFVRTLEDSVEMSESPSVGSAFWDVCEGNEFDVYIKYACDILSPFCLETIYTLLEQQKIKQKIESRGTGFLLAVKYVLPKLLQGPIIHCFEYFEYLQVLQRLAECETDKEDLMNSQSQLFGLKSQLEQECTALKKQSLIREFNFRTWQTAGRHAHQLTKMQQIQKNIDGWEGKDIGYSCTEFIREGMIGKVRYNAKIGLGATDTLRGKSRSYTERYVFLFDNLIILCKMSNKKPSATGANPEYKLKEKLPVRKVDIVDREDSEDLKFAFEIRTRERPDQPPVILIARNSEEKQTWMASLVMLQTRNMLDRMLDSFLKEQEKRIPLVVPSPEQYRFSEPDSDDSIMFEDYTSSSGIPVVKAGTVPKLVERLTYHLYSDSKFIRTFLTTFRSFCSPMELLNLLTERFEIPQPTFEEFGIPISPKNGPISPNEFDSNSSLIEQSLQRFRKEYMNPIQIRVLCIVRHWVVRHWYDFEQNQELLLRLLEFLDGIHGNFLRKWVQSIQTNIERMSRSISAEEEEFRRKNRDEIEAFGPKPPPSVWHLCDPGDIELYDLLTLHPLEIGRQITLLESDLYRAVKPVELVGAAWMKKDKDTRSPQLLKLTKHSNMITFWLGRCVVETENLEERVALLSRMLEIMHVFEELNNFNGLMEFYSALNSAAVYRLHWTWARLDRDKRDSYQRFKQLIGGGHGKAYKERLKQINPPCVPFFGHYLSTIFFLDEGNPTFFNDPDLNDTTQSDTVSVMTQTQPLVSFYKCRKIATVIAEIQMYQNQPYTLKFEESVRHFFECLNPLKDFEDKSSLEEYLYDQSLKIEPKDTDKLPNFPPTRSTAALKSPGLKANTSNHRMRILNSMKVGVSGSFNKDSVPLFGHDDIKDKPSSPKEVSGNSNFAMVDIRPGQAPRYVRDVPGPWDVHRSNPSPLPGERAVSPSLRAGSPSIDHAPAPPLPPRAMGRSPMPGMKPLPRSNGPSPKSPLSPLQQQSLQSNRPPSPTSFVFPPPPIAPRSSGTALTPPSPMDSVAPPQLPPRKPVTPPRHQPLPAPLSPTTVQEAMGGWNNGQNSRSMSPLVVSGGNTPRSKSPAVLTPFVQTKAPPLPPKKGANGKLVPPPRPPKRLQNLSGDASSLSPPRTEPTPPPLPPKTYKQKKQQELR